MGWDKGKARETGKGTHSPFWSRLFQQRTVSSRLTTTGIEFQKQWSGICSVNTLFPIVVIIRNFIACLDNVWWQQRKAVGKAQCIFIPTRNIQGPPLDLTHNMVKYRFTTWIYYPGQQTSANFSVKSQMVNILNFAGYSVIIVITIHFHHSNVKVAIDNT